MNKLEKMIKETEKGKKIFINAIRMNTKWVECLRDCIEKGDLIPDVSGYAVPEDVASGKVILPQNDYTVNV